MAGKPPHVPTDESKAQVKALAAYGAPHDDISKIIGIDAKTLRKRYRHELDTATTEANAKVAQSLFQQATARENPSVPAAIFWLKVRAGWTEKSALEIVSKMSDEELEAKAAELLRSRAGDTH